jgi:hypothetical protein
MPDPDNGTYQEIRQHLEAAVAATSDLDIDIDRTGSIRFALLDALDELSFLEAIEEAERG